MPAKNSRKQYLVNGYYHLYNRGVEKRVVFLDEQDYSVFLSYLKDYLLPKNKSSLLQTIADPHANSKQKDKVLKLLRLNNFADTISLLAYCLMPNHFHFLVKQTQAESIAKFTNSLCTRYTMYFNRKYNRVGPLYQGVYKAVLVTSEEQLLHLSRYIHSQASQGEALQPCSYLEYLGQRQTAWIKPDEILSYFSKTNPSLSYSAFMNLKEDYSTLSPILL
ncbi:MAG: hypothetical protein UX80_C0035G0010 [Candidatus Amesbacteria bacterium GW2011_GWA2_47_11b]|uniref:Transposase IS200-like domain-containing protein n=1 Tax=Candidatus Amesbacteria bacterium GW2011_GWA2_47_11b TaxID=1618358 RepID=A0A0G1UFQ2_9BACT|nr:MAG: Transposase [Microgenomates group bacterium GW2011_GWC1_46_20]KKU56535.1 MAG: hypothetical protein UX80_C0035G0010 [Candidatus Amesbacteria bacterium GW2011_GWA2_47_11b]